MRLAPAGFVVAATLTAAACGDSGGTATPSTATALAEQRFPDVVGVEAEQADDGTWTFRVTISSPYDTPDRYADGWRIVGPDGTVYGEHRLAHDHAGEQPFTRTQRGVTIPGDIVEVTVEGRDREFGYGGSSLGVTLADT